MTGLVAGTVLTVAGGPQPAVAARPATPAASVAAHRYDPAHSAVVSRRGQETDYANPDGTYTAVLATHAVNYALPNGSWQPIDNHLVADPAQPGGLTNRANAWRVHFGTSKRGVSVDTSAGSLAVSPDGARGTVQPQTGPAGDSVLYQDVWPGADLKYTVTGDAVKESLLIKDRTAGASFAFAVRSAATAEQTRNGRGTPTQLVAQPDGTVTPDGALGAMVRFAAPAVIGADGQPVAAANPRMTASAGRLVLSVDPGWLAAQPDSAFPIDFDPSIFVHPDNDRPFRSDGAACTNGTSCMIQVGNARDGGDTYWRTVAHFPYESLFGDHVLGVSIGTGWQAGTLNAYTVHVYWASAYSYAGAVRGSVLASGTPANSGQALSGSGLTNQVSSWVTNRTSGGAFGFTGTETAGLYTYQKFDMALYVDYDRPPNKPGSLSFSSPARGCVTGAGRPVIDGTFPFVLKATQSDPDGNNIRGYFELWNLAHTSRLKAVTSAVVGSGKAVTVSFPANTLGDGTSFAWRVRSWDGYLYGDWSGWCEATIHDPPPNVPTGLKFSLPQASCVIGAARPAMRGDQTISLSATISDPNKRNVYANFQVSKTGDASTVYWTGKSATVASGSTVTVTIPAKKLADGTAFSWHVNASNGMLTSGYSGWCEATVDNTAPTAPQVASADFGVAGDVAAGTVGVPGTVTVSSSTDTVKYVWSLTDLPATPPACGASAGGATTICVTAGAPASFVLEPEEAEPTVHVRAYDKAGNHSEGATTFFVNEVVPAHGWLTDFADGTETSLDDLPSATTPEQLFLGGTDGQFVGDGRFGAALHLDGTPTNVGRTLPAALDTTQSFSVVGFIRQEAFTSGEWQTIAVQEAGATVSFAVGVDGNDHLLFCVQNSQPPDGTFVSDCAWSGYAPTLGEWNTVIAVWDAPAHQLRLYLDGALIASQTHTTTPVTSGPLDIGCGQAYGYLYSCWNGDIEDPVVYQGVLDQDQIDYISQYGFGG